MFDGENCDAGSGLLKIKKGGAGKLAKWSPFPSSELERNDVESLIVQAHCQLELWDDDDGLENGDSPDLIIDNSVSSQISNNQSSCCIFLVLFLSKIY